MLASSIRASSMYHRAAQRIAILLLAVAIAGCGFDVLPVQAQEFRFPERPRAAPKPKTGRMSDKAPMLLQATEIHYDYTNKQVSAIGSVQIYHAGTTLEADKVVYDENTKRMHAEGNVRLTVGSGAEKYGK